MTTSSAKAVSSTQMSDVVLQLIDQHWTHVQSRLPEKSQKNMIFVIGSPSAGKSTVAQIIAGDFEKLHSKLCETETVLCPHPQPEPHFLIEDEHGIIRRTDLKRILPEFLALDDTTSLVDCPSFDDNDDDVQEILARALMKKIVERVDNVRFLWVISFSSLFDSMHDTIDFTGLFDNPQWFFANIEKIHDSISLVITKVRENDPVTRKKLNVDEIFDRTEKFLQYSTKRAEHKTFVKYLLKSRSKWVVIRIPSWEGPLNTMEYFTQAREQLRELCQRKLKATVVNSDDMAWLLFLEYLESVKLSKKTLDNTG